MSMQDNIKDYSFIYFYYYYVVDRKTNQMAVRIPQVLLSCNLFINLFCFVILISKYLIVISFLTSHFLSSCFYFGFYTSNET
jgi:hypothetical protein